MTIQDRRAIKYSAVQALNTAPGNPKITVLVYTAGSAVLALLLSVISMMLGNRISNTGGLSNIGLRSILSTAQSVLPLLQILISFCLGLGYDSAALKMARRQEATPRTLLDGFLLFGPLMRSLLLQGLIYLSIGFGAMYAASFIFMMSPFSGDFYELMEPLLTSTTILSSEVVMDDATLMAAAQALLPMIPIFLVIFAAVATPIMYQYRMVNFCLIDASRPRALIAMRDSINMMRKNKLQLFKLDLSFWWFYLAQLVISLTAYGDILLPLLGVIFPWSDTVSFYLFYVVSLVLQIALYYLCLNKVQVAYATAYEALRPQPQEPQSQGVPLGNIFDMR